MTIDKHLKITMTRSQFCDLLLATRMVSQAAPAQSKWKDLHDEMWKLLDDWDTVAANNDLKACMKEMKK